MRPTGRADRGPCALARRWRKAGPTSLIDHPWRCSMPKAAGEPDPDQRQKDQKGYQPDGAAPVPEIQGAEDCSDDHEPPAARLVPGWPGPRLFQRRRIDMRSASPGGFDPLREPGEPCFSRHDGEQQRSARCHRTRVNRCPGLPGSSGAEVGPAQRCHRRARASASSIGASAPCAPSAGSGHGGRHSICRPVDSARSLWEMHPSVHHPHLAHV